MLDYTAPADSGRDRKLTLSQNYQRLGLSSRLGGRSGGVEKTGKENEYTRTVDSLAIPAARKTGKLLPEEVRVQRDPETGSILRVIRPDQDQTVPNPLHDPLNDLEEQEVTTSKPSDNGIIADLEREAAEEEQRLAKKRPRQQSQREEEWIMRLVEKHGQDSRAMARDKKLNPMQQAEGDISRRVRKWQQKQSAGV